VTTFYEVVNFGYLSFSVPVFSVAERGKRKFPFSPGIGPQGNIFVIVIVAEKGLHAAVSPLREMMRYARYDDPCYLRRAGNVAGIS